IVPVIALIHLWRAPARWRMRFAQLGVAGIVLAAVSLAWVLLYELTPPADRPFVDSSPDNSMLQLVVGHNALQRFVYPHPERRAPGIAAMGGDTAAVARASGRDGAPAGPLRLAAPRLAAQMAWLFPLALIGGLAAWARSRRGDADRLDLLLWAGWALIYGIVFSAAGGLFHAYYLAVLAPPLAALAGIGAAALWSFYRRAGRIAL